MAEEPIRILVAEDDPALGDRLVDLLGKQADLCVVGRAGTVLEAVTQTVDHGPDVVLLDFDLPDGSGVDASAVIRYMRPQIRQVFLVRDAVRLPAGIDTPSIRISVAEREIVEVIRRVARGGSADRNS